MSIMRHAYCARLFPVTLEREKPAAAGAVAPGRLAYQGSTGYLLSKAGSMAKQRWMRMLAEVGVNPSQFGALMALGEAGPTCQQQLAELIGIDPRNLVPIIETLVGQGLVSREVDAADRRRRVLGLTRTGRALVSDLESVSDQLEEGLMGSLAPDEQVALRRILVRLLDAYSESG